MREKFYSARISHPHAVVAGTVIQDQQHREVVFAQVILGISYRYARRERMADLREILVRSLATFV